MVWKYPILTPQWNFVCGCEKKEIIKTFLCAVYTESQNIEKSSQRLFSEDSAVEIVFFSVVRTKGFSLVCLFKATDAGRSGTVFDSVDVKLHFCTQRHYVRAQRKKITYLN